MAAALRWTDVHDIAVALADKYREQAPRELSLADVQRYVTSMPSFVDDPKASSEPNLAAIQTAWHEEWEDRTR